MTDRELLIMNVCPTCAERKRKNCYRYDVDICTATFTAGRRVEQTLRERETLTNKCETCKLRDTNDKWYNEYICKTCKYDHYERRN